MIEIEIEGGRADSPPIHSMMSPTASSTRDILANVSGSFNLRTTPILPSAETHVRVQEGTQRDVDFLCCCCSPLLLLLLLLPW